MIVRLIRSRDGATAIEYAMIAALIAILLITSLTGIGVDLEAIFEAVASGFDGVAP